MNTEHDSSADLEEHRAHLTALRQQDAPEGERRAACVAYLRSIKAANASVEDSDTVLILQTMGVETDSPTEEQLDAEIGAIAELYRRSA